MNRLTNNPIFGKKLEKLYKHIKGNLKQRNKEREK